MRSKVERHSEEAEKAVTSFFNTFRTSPSLAIMKTATRLRFPQRSDNGSRAHQMTIKAAFEDIPAK